MPEKGFLSLMYELQNWSSKNNDLILEDVLSKTAKKFLKSVNLHPNCNERNLAHLEDKECKCKPLVTGKYCNKCKQGAWNLTQENPLGCQKCTCKIGDFF